MPYRCDAWILEKQKARLHNSCARPRRAGQCPTKLRYGNSRGVSRFQWNKPLFLCVDFMHVGTGANEGAHLRAPMRMSGFSPSCNPILSATNEEDLANAIPSQSVSVYT